MPSSHLSLQLWNRCVGYANLYGKHCIILYSFIASINQNDLNQWSEILAVFHSDLRHSYKKCHTGLPQRMQKLLTFVFTCVIFMRNEERGKLELSSENFVHSSAAADQVGPHSTFTLGCGAAPESRNESANRSRVFRLLSGQTRR